MKLRRVRAVVRKESQEIARDPITLAVALVIPLVMLTLFGYAISLDVREVPMALWDQDGTPQSRALADAFERSGYFVLVHRVADSRGLRTTLDSARATLVLVVPPRFAARLARGERVAVQVLVDGTYSNTAEIVAAYADRIVARFGRRGAARIEPEVRVWFNAEMRSANYVVPGLFGVILLALPPLLTALAVVREKETGSIQQVFASPLTGGEFLLGKLLPYGAIAFVQMLLVVGFGLFWFDVPVRGSLALLLAIGLVYVLCTVGLGLLVSTITRKQVVAMLLALVLTLMPSFLFSGLLFPIFTMPYALQLYAGSFPGRYFVDLSRDVVMKGAGLADVWRNVAILGVYTLAVFALAAFRFRKKVA